MVTIKIHKKTKDGTIQSEVAMQVPVRSLDPDRRDIVRFMGNFRFNGLPSKC